MTTQTQPKPPKRGAALPLGRPIDRLQPIDRVRIRADVAAFLAYARRRPGTRSVVADAWQELAAADLEDEQ